MKQSIGFSVVVMTLFGCSTVPSEPVLPDGRAKVTVNNQSAIAKTMSDYYRAQADKKARAESPRLLAKMTINQIVERYMPADFRVYAAEGVDLDTTVDYEASRPWTEALGKPLSDAGIEMTANLEQRTMLLRIGTTTIEQILNQQVPSDYTVYADESVRLDQPIKLDRSKPWVEALGKALAAAGISMTANVDKKLVILKAKPMPRIIRFKDEESLAGAISPAQRTQNSGQQDGYKKSNPSNN